MTSLNSSNNGTNNNNNNNATTINNIASSSSSSSSSSNQPNQGQTNFYRLKVEDALSYLDQVKFQFDKQPEVYNQFLDIMKEFKSQTIDTPGVISRVSTLFRGHNDLIEGFNTFLPPGYKIEIQANDSVHYTGPNSTISTLVNQNTLLPKSRNIQPISTPIPLVATPIVPALSITSGIGQNLIKNETVKIEPLVLTTLPNNSNNNNTNLKNIPINQSVKLAQIPTAPLIAANSRPVSTPPPASSASSSSSSSSSASSSTTSSISSHHVAQQLNQNQNQVEFGHAINYVNKIKSRFHNQPDVYKSFLEILHTYQKQQKNLKDGIVTGTFLSEAEVYAKVANLFKNQEDLLAEFSQFLPDANNGSNLNQSSQNLIQQQNTIQDYASVNLTTAQPILQAQTVLNAPIPTIISNVTNTQVKPSQLQHQQQSQNSNLTNQKTSKLNENLNTPSKQERPQTPVNQLQTNPNINNTNLNQRGNLTLNVNINNNQSVKRSLNNQQLPSKKQKIGQTLTSNTINQKMNSNLGQQQNTISKNLSKNLTNNNSTNQKSTQQLQNQHQAQNLTLDSIKYGPINEITFFEKLKKALRTQQVYENFLKCLALFNQDIITRSELIKIVEPFLGKFSNLYRWFKDYVENNQFNNSHDSLIDAENNLNNKNNENSTLNSKQSNLDSLNKYSNANKNNLLSKINLPNGSNNIHLEIDYLSCKQYGASYRDISSYPQPISSGQTELCKQVLNATYVSFPSWSEDSTFISSKKNQYEELIFRIEDERFELDVVLETNLSTIRVLENVMAKMSKMKTEELSKLRLDNTLGGDSEIIHLKAVQRIYGDKSKDFIEGLKQNPQVAVPLVLKRLKAKDEEWREAKKNLEKTWKEQIERNYLKSLDYCAGPFKQNDQKHLKTKSLITEIEQLYYERQSVREEFSNANQALSSALGSQSIEINKVVIQHNEPHVSFKYDDKSILEDAAALIIHHVKRQTAIQKEDKHKIKQIIYHFLPDLFFVSRGALSDDESSLPDPYKNENSINLEENNTKKLRSNNSTQNLNTTPTRHTDTNKRRLTDMEIDRSKDLPIEYKSPEDMYRLFYVDEHWYLFFRYHQILCERLFKIYKHSQQIAEQQAQEAKNREQSVAEALKLRNKSDISPDEYYPTFLDIVRNLLDGNMDSTQYEDTLREMFGIHAYVAFTLDKVVHNCVRQLQYLAQDEMSICVKQFFTDEQKLGSNCGSGGKVTNMSYSTVMNSELTYQKKIESLLSDQNVYKFLIYKNSCRMTIELLDPQRDEEDDEDEEIEIEKWTEFIDKYCTSNNHITEEIKNELLKRPVFLTRNAHCLKHKFSQNNKTESHNINDNNNNSSEADIKKADESETNSNKSTDKHRLEINETKLMYRRNSFKNARKSHHQVTKKMYDKFRKHLNKWLKENSIPQDAVDDWLLGEHLDNNNDTKTVCQKESWLKKTPYHVYYKYKVVNKSSETNNGKAKSKNEPGTTKKIGKNNQVENEVGEVKLESQNDMDVDLKKD